MSLTEHGHAIQSALQTGDKLQFLFDALGSRGQPTRGVWGVFGLARQTLAGHLDDMRLVNRTLSQVREATVSAVESQILAAARVGEKQATREIAVYAELSPVDADTDPFVEGATLAVVAEIDALLSQVRALAMTGADETLILGQDPNILAASRTGVLRASDIVAAAIVWIAKAAVGAYERTIEGAVSESGAPQQWMKQAVAAIDGRTTDCCLRVHGQVVPLKGQFTLTGTPRYADKMDGPPFGPHRCRTATCLVRAEDARDELTRKMQDAGRLELAARAANDPRGYKFPVDAFGGRLDF